ncbi:MAG: hypothetical protein ACM30G_12435 [Micromonosporaceae bacterium]
MIASRGCRRSLRAAAVGAVLLGITACSAGQITQTANQVAVVPGVNVDIGPDSQIGLRNLQIAYNGPSGYAKGGTAPLLVRIFNSGPTPVTLTGVSASGFADKVTLVGSTRATPLPTPRPTAAASPSATAAPSASAPGTPRPSGSAQPPASPSASPTPAATTPRASAGEDTFAITIDPNSYVLLVPGQGGYLQLVGLVSALRPGQAVRMEFTFDNALRAQVDVPIGVPNTPLPRATVTHEPEGA